MTRVTKFTFLQFKKMNVSYLDELYSLIQVSVCFFQFSLCQYEDVLRHIVAKKDIKFKMAFRAKARSVQSSSFSLLGLDLSHEHIHIYMDFVPWFLSSSEFCVCVYYLRFSVPWGIPRALQAIRVNCHMKLAITVNLGLPLHVCIKGVGQHLVNHT